MEGACDVVIIGGGILGVSSAYHIKKNSPTRSVLLIERLQGLGQGNTGRSNAMFRNTFSSSDNQLLAESSIDFYLHVQDELGIDLGMELVGYLWLMNDNQLSRSMKYVDKMKRNDIQTRLYTKRELQELMPGMNTEFNSNDEEANILGLTDVRGAVFGPKCGRLDPDRLVGFYRDQFLSIGGRVAVNTNAVELLVEPRAPLGLPGEPLAWQEADVVGVRVTGAIAGEIRAGTVVIASGAWNNELLEPKGLDGRVKAKKRQLFSVGAKGNERLMQLLHTKGFNKLGTVPMVILPKAGVHFKGVRIANEFWVQCEDNLDRPFVDVPPGDFSSLSAESAYYERSIYPVLRSYFPQFTNARLKSTWAGYYSYNTLDFLPFVEREGNVILLGGDSGSGIMKGDALGRIVDCVYRDGEEAEAKLYGDVSYAASKLGFKSRDVEREEWVL